MAGETIFLLNKQKLISPLLFNTLETEGYIVKTIRDYKELKIIADQMMPNLLIMELTSVMDDMQTFKDNLDDLTKFVGYTTAIILVFLFFPRLKLVSLLVFNLTNLAWDIAFPKRAVKPIRSEDLLSRLIAKTFKM